MQNPTCFYFMRFLLAGVLMQFACGERERFPVFVKRKWRIWWCLLLDVSCWCPVLGLCTICAAAFDVDVPAPAGALVPCILHCQKPLNKMWRIVYFGISALLLLNLQPAGHWPHRRRWFCLKNALFESLKFFYVRNFIGALLKAFVFILSVLIPWENLRVFMCVFTVILYDLLIMQNELFWAG